MRLLQPAIVDTYVGPGGTIVYLDLQFNPATDRLARQLSAPWGQQYGIPVEYNNQPDGEGSDQGFNYLTSPPHLTVFAGGYALHVPPNIATHQALSVERAGVRSKAYYWHRPRIYGVHGRTNWPGGRIHVWGHRVGGRNPFGGKSAVYLRADDGTMRQCTVRDSVREMEADRQQLIQVVVPDGVPLGKYDLVLHASEGQQWGWSGLEPVEIIAAPVRTGAVQTVSPTTDGSSAWEALNAAVQAAGPGGTVRLLPGDYYFTDKALELLPGQTITGKGAWIISSRIVTADDCIVTRLSFTGTLEQIVIYAPKFKLPSGGEFLDAERVTINECHFEWVQLQTFGRGWRINDCTFHRSGLQYGSEAYIKGCRFEKLGPHHACITWGARDSLLIENVIDGADRGFVQFFARGSVAGCFWYRNEVQNISQVHNGCEHFLTEGGSTKVFGLAMHVKGSTYQLDKPITGAFVSQTPYAVRHFDDQTTEAVRVLGLENDESGQLTRFRLAQPFRSQRAEVPVKLVYGFFDNQIVKTRMRDGLGAALNIFGTMAHNNRFSNLVSFGPMYVKVFGLPNSSPTTGIVFVDCELHGGRVHFSGPARYNVIDGLVVTDPLISGANQFSYVIAAREIALAALESKGTGNAILRAAVMRPGGLVVQSGFDHVGELTVVGE